MTYILSRYFCTYCYVHTEGLHVYGRRSYTFLHFFFSSLFLLHSSEVSSSRLISEVLSLAASVSSFSFIFKSVQHCLTSLFHVECVFYICLNILALLSQLQEYICSHKPAQEICYLPNQQLQLKFIVQVKCLL